MSRIAVVGGHGQIASSSSWSDGRATALSSRRAVLVGGRTPVGEAIRAAVAG